MPEKRDPKLEALLDHIRRSRGFDFTGYKRPTLERRILKRMRFVGVSDYIDYRDYLEVHPDEFSELFDTILINVTSFFRDKPAWDHLAANVIPAIMARKGPSAPMRMWSAGCASGEEPFSLAILMAEALGIDAFRARVKIYATDVDESALAQARQATYASKCLADMDERLLKAYFDKEDAGYSLKPDLRRAVIFGRHDLVRDAPISRVDLLACRNTLMYLNSEVQNRVLERLHFALSDGGVLFLGKAEMMLTHADLFAPFDLKHRTFLKKESVGLAERLPGRSRPGVILDPASAPDPTLRDTAFDSGIAAQIVVDAENRLSMFNARARAEFSLGDDDVGRALQDLEISYRPIELRTAIEQAGAQHAPLRLSDVERPASAQRQYFDIEVVPLQDPAGSPAGTSVSFLDVTERLELVSELDRARQELETTSEELQSTNEELETTNEELQSTNEELETTNEELQSTNEELETTNEELRSTNEELETLNTELQLRSTETRKVNAFLQSILASLRAAVVVVDRRLTVLIWNHRAEDLWGLHSDEAEGRSLLDLDIGLPVEEIPIARFLAGRGGYNEVTVEATTRRGKRITCRITGTPYIDVDGKRQGVVLLMEEEA